MSRTRGRSRRAGSLRAAAIRCMITAAEQQVLQVQHRLGSGRPSAARPTTSRALGTGASSPGAAAGDEGGRIRRAAAAQQTATNALRPARGTAGLATFTGLSTGRPASRFGHLRQAVAHGLEHIQRDAAEGGELPAGNGEQPGLLPHDVIARFLGGVRLPGTDDGAHTGESADDVVQGQVQRWILRRGPQPSDRRRHSCGLMRGFSLSSSAAS